MSYNVPFYKFHGTHVGFPAFENHATVGIGADALGIGDRNVLEESGYETGKETIQIGYDQSVPNEQIQKLLVRKAWAAREVE